jgi:hypothetical protein
MVQPEVEHMVQPEVEHMLSLEVEHMLSPVQKWLARKTVPEGPLWPPGSRPAPAPAPAMCVCRHIRH